MLRNGAIESERGQQARVLCKSASGRSEQGQQQVEVLCKGAIKSVRGKQAGVLRKGANGASKASRPDVAQ